MTKRVIGWVSGGAASAVACKLGQARYGKDMVLAYIDTGAEHKDTDRFLGDLERWYGQEIIRISSNTYFDTWDVWTRKRFLRGPQGAACTYALKRKVRADFELPGDHHLWGYTAEEKRRADRFKRDFCTTMTLEFPLIDQNVSKADCYAIVKRAGIELPVPYLLGFDNNNCLPCVKAEGAKYWNRIRRNFPFEFNRMAKLERELGYALCRISVKGVKTSVFLDELDPEAGIDDDTPEPISCGISCAVAEAAIQERESMW